MTVVIDHGRRRDGNTGSDDDVDMARDRLLISRAQHGDRSAFDELYLHYSRRLYRLCLRRLSDPHEAEDVAQEAFVRAWRALPRFCGERRFYPWLSVIAANLCTDVLRKRSRSTPVAEFFGSDPDSGEEVDDRLLHEVDAAMVGEALTKLTERHRRILSLREDAGMTYQAIADHEGVAVSAVETLLWRARQALKREFCALAEAAEGKGAALVGLGIVGRLLSHVLRLPVRTAKRLAHFTPASAVLTVASISAVGALATGVTRVAAPTAGQSTALGTHLLGDAPGVPGPTGAVPGAPGAVSDQPGVEGGATNSADGGARGPASTGMSGATGPGGSGVGSEFSSSGSGGGGPTAGAGGSASGAGLGALLGALSSGDSSGGGVTAVTHGVTKGVSAAAGSVGSMLSSVTEEATGAGLTAGDTVSGVTQSVSASAAAAAGSVGATLSTVSDAASGGVGTVRGVTKNASAGEGSAGTTISNVTQAGSDTAGPVSGVVKSVVGGAPTLSSTVPPVTGGGSLSSGGIAGVFG